MGIKNLFIRSKAKEPENEDIITALQKEVKYRDAIVKQVSDDIDRLNERLLKTVSLEAQEDQSKKR